MSAPTPDWEGLKAKIEALPKPAREYVMPEFEAARERVRRREAGEWEVWAGSEEAEFDRAELSYKNVLNTILVRAQSGWRSSYIVPILGALGGLIAGFEFYHRLLRLPGNLEYSFAGQVLTGIGVIVSVLFAYAGFRIVQRLIGQR